MNHSFRKERLSIFSIEVDDDCRWIEYYIIIYHRKYGRTVLALTLF